MKKIIIFAVLALLVGTYSYAQDTEFETIENSFYFKLRHTIPVSYSQKIKDSFLDGNDSEVLTDFLKACVPYNENININFFGFDFSLNAKNNGWVNDKCSYEFYGKINSISSYAKQMMNITADDSQISAIEPKFECNFDKKQLELFATEIMSGTRRNMGTKEAIYKPAQNDLKTKSKKRAEFLSMIKDPNVCRIVNEEDILKAFQIFSPTPDFSE